MRCIFCGCSDTAACVGGCTWVARFDLGAGVCSQCSGRYAATALIEPARIDAPLIDVVQSFEGEVLSASHVGELGR
jgi:hypothetical protein